MAKIVPPRDVQIGAVDQRDRVAYYNLMEPGPGTPWEDRGSVGLAGALVRTIAQALTSPTRLFRSLRRPETLQDSQSFAVVCSIFWVVSGIVHETIATSADRNNPEIDPSTIRFVLQLLVTAVLFGGGALVLCRLLARMHYNMVHLEMTSKAPHILWQNLFNYCLAPSILSILPFVGPPLAGGLSGWLIYKASVNRLYVSTKGSIIATALCAAAGLGLAVLAFAAQWAFWRWVYGPTYFPKVH